MPVIPSPNAPWRAHSLLCAAALAVALAGCSGEAAVEPAAAAITPDPDAIAFVGVNVVPMDSERVLEGHTVVVQGGRISSVTADDSQVPEGAQRIDGEGRWLMPGLAEMHGHVPGPDDPQYAEDVLFLYVSNGVTTVRNMAGNASHLALRERVEAGDLVGPTLFAASPWLTPDSAGTPAAAAQWLDSNESAMAANQAAAVSAPLAVQANNNPPHS